MLAPNATRDRVCMECTRCDAATQFVASECMPRMDRVCQNLTECAPATEYITVQPTLVSDRQCGNLTQCDAGNEFAIVPATRTSDRICAACASCTPGFYESQPCNLTQNRVCTPCSACDFSFQYRTLACTASADRVCLNVTQCLPETEYQVRAPTRTSDRVCRALRQCDAEQFERVSPTLTSDRVCNATEQCTSLEYERVPPTATSDRTCQALTLCDLDDEYIAQVATNTSDRVCAPLTQCQVFESIAVNATTFSDRVCTCVQASDAILTATLTLRDLAAAILEATDATQARFALNAAEAVLQTARRSLATLPALAPEGNDGRLTREELAGLYGLSICSIEVVDTGAAATFDDGGGGGGGSGASRRDVGRRDISRRAIEPLGRDSFVNVTWAVPAALADELACLFSEAGNTEQSAFNLARLEPEFVQFNSSLAVSPVRRQADGSCACGCVATPEGSGDDDAVGVLAYILAPLAALLLLVLLLILLAVRRRRQAAYVKPPSLLPPYLAPPAFVSRLVPEHEKRVRDPYGANRAPPYRPPPSYPGLPQDRTATALSRAPGAKGRGAPSGDLPRDAHSGHHVPPYREPPTYGDALLTITRRGFPEGRQAAGRMQPRRRYSGLDDLLSDADPLLRDNFLDDEDDRYFDGGLGYDDTDGEADHRGSGLPSDIGDFEAMNLLDLDMMTPWEGERMLSNPGYAGLAPTSRRADPLAFGSPSAGRDASDYLQGPRHLPDYAEPPMSQASHMDGTLSPPAYEEPPRFPPG